MSDEFESSIKNCNNLQQLCEKCGSKRDEASSSLKPAVDLLHDVFKRLELKGKSFEVYKAAAEDEIQEFREVLLLVDATLKTEDTTKKSIKQKTDVCFMKHCCKIRHYSFQIKKCGSFSCKICKPVRMDSEMFSTVNFLPDPIPQGDGHYKHFADVYRQKTSKQYCPSLQLSNAVSER